MNYRRFAAVLISCVASLSACAQGDEMGTRDGAVADSGAADAQSNPVEDSGTSGAMDSGTAPVSDASGPRDAGVAPVDTGVGGPSSPYASLEDEILAITNQRRAAGANCGGTNYPAVGPLVMNAQLRQAARAHSMDMGARNYFDHNTPEGTTPFQRIAAAGYTGSPQGENIAAGNDTAAETMTQWMNSPGHCRNIMNGEFRALGVGYARVAGSRYTHYWTQNFGGR